ncbi:MAG: isoamylase [Nitrospira sp.]|nr:isoamylase [Nitrospira sp.]
MNGWTRTEGASAPLGVTWLEEEQAYNFALYARHASTVTLLVYAESDLTAPVFESSLSHLKNKSGRVWHCCVPVADLKNGRYYAYRVDGQGDDSFGHRFDPSKVLLDPYARGVFFPPAFSRAAANGSAANDGRAPLGLLPKRGQPFDWGIDVRPIHTSDTIIYEVHVRGFTRSARSGVRDAFRGTFTGLIEKIPYLTDLGVTVVELLPVYQYDPDESNYWGYMPLGFFSPHQAYAAEGSAEGAFDEFRHMVKALHAAGIEVILDVVYNHTSEAGASGPTYSFRGIDNSTYYVLRSDGRTYRDETGTGNMLRTAHPAVRKLILDSMRFWAKEMHIDGFRFDLASILTRNNDGSLNLEDPAAISEITADPDFEHIRLIAEAWDMSSYQLGRSFPGMSWLQWNGQFRDDMRSFVKSDSRTVPAVMRRLYGSDDLFPDDLLDAYHPYQSINYVTSHDGFCLYDLVSYNQKHNEANGHQNRDGTDNNVSWNCGWEGDLDVPPEVMALRMRQIKNFCCLLMLANGTPMFTAGDEFMQTQQGNNNPYNQDNQTTWLNWDLLEKHQDMFRFWKRMIAFRKAHPSLSRSRFWRDDIRWYGTGTTPDLSEHSHSLAWCLHGASQGDRDIYCMANAYWEPLSFTIQEGQNGDWRRAIDTSFATPNDIMEPNTEPLLPTLRYTVTPRSIVVLLRV